jgi:hypothetical protein
MNYYVLRNDQQYGPYTLADLQRYVASGNILVTDLTRSEGMADWVTVSQVIGNIPVPVAARTPAISAGSLYPDPPNLHWGILLLLAMITCGLFNWVWVFIQAAWVRKVQPQSKCMIYLVTAVGLFVVSVFLSFDKTVAPFAGILNLIGAGFWLAGVFSMRSAIEDHYNSAEPIGLRLGGVMTFFFNVVYFQYHFTRIDEMKRNGQLTMTPGQWQG